MAKVISFRSVGGAYKRGVWHPGFAQCELDDGTQLHVPEEYSRGLAHILDYTERQGHDVTEMRARLSEWINTGRGFGFSVIP